MMVLLMGSLAIIIQACNILSSIVRLQFEEEFDFLDFRLDFIHLVLSESMVSIPLCVSIAV